MTTLQPGMPGHRHADVRTSTVMADSDDVDDHDADDGDFSDTLEEIPSSFILPHRSQPWWRFWPRRLHCWLCSHIFSVSTIFSPFHPYSSLSSAVGGNNLRSKSFRNWVPRVPRPWGGVVAGMFYFLFLWSYGPVLDLRPDNMWGICFVVATIKIVISPPQKTLKQIFPTKFGSATKIIRLTPFPIANLKSKIVEKLRYKILFKFLKSHGSHSRQTGLQCARRDTFVPNESHSLHTGPTCAKPSIRKNWRTIQLNRSEIGTTNAFQCQVPVWSDHTIGPRTAKNGNNYCTAMERNMGRSAHGNLLQCVNLQNRRKACSSYSHYAFYVISPAVAKCGSRSCTDNTSIWPVLYQILYVYTYTKRQQLKVCKRWGYLMGGDGGGSYIARCTKMRKLKRDGQANSSFLHHRHVYPYMYTYMSEEEKRWMFLPCLTYH